VHHRAEDLLDPKDTSGGTCTYIPDPTDLDLDPKKIFLEEFVHMHQIQRIWNKYVRSTSPRNLRDILSCFSSVESSR
jgi:hypothetical protein